MLEVWVVQDHVLDLSAAPGVLGTAVQDMCKQLRVEAGGIPLPAQVRVHGDDQLAAK